MAGDEERLVAAAKNSVGENGASIQKYETPQGMWLGGARTGSLWHCYTRHLAGKQKSGILGCQ